MKLRRINFDHGAGCGCGDCTGGNAKSYFEGLEQKPNIEQLVPVPGPSGENSILVAGKTDPSGALNADGADEALDSAAKANLLAADFDITEKPTTQNVVDASDTNSNRVWTGLSRSLLNFLGLKVVPKLLPDFGTSGNIVKDNGTAWVSGAPDWEKYNSTTTSPVPYNSTETSRIGQTIEFTVGTGYSYRFKNIVAIVDPSDSLNYLEGIVTNYSLGKVTVRIMNMSGSGNTSGWNVMLTAPEYLPYVNDPANYGKFFYNNNGIIEMRTSIESIGDTKIWFSATAPDTSWWLCDGSTKLLSESPGLYDLLVTKNGGFSSPFYVSGTSFKLPDSTGAALVGVKVGGSDSISLGQLVGSNILTGGILPKHLPVASPWQINDPGHSHPIVPAGAFEAGAGGTSVPFNGAGNTNTATTGITLKQNNVAGGMPDNGAQDLDIRQKSLGFYLYIKAL